MSFKWEGIHPSFGNRKYENAGRKVAQSFIVYERGRKVID